MKYVKLCVIFMLIAGIYTSARAQGAPDVLRYSLQYPGNDPISITLPGVSDATGFGAYQENPASMALFDKSFFSVGLSDRYVIEDGTYLGNTTGFDDNQVDISNAGFVYNVPTQQGKLTIGAGYSQSHDFNRALSVTGRNNQTSITDFYNSTPDDSLFFSAFDAYAVDYATPDSSYDETASIFRVDSPYRGINQNADITEKGVLGEYSAFIATEFQKNLIVGASIGVISGTYSYRRDFLESDSQNDYETQFVDDNGNAIGIDNILSKDSIDENFTAFSLRLGAIYQPTDNVNIGASYQFKNVLNISEDFNTVITNTLDDGTFFKEDSPGHYDYKIVRPARFNVGITAKDLSGLTLFAAAEHVAYSDGRIRFKGLNSKDAEIAENNTVKAALNDVINLRFGLQYAVNKQFMPRIGYAYYPSPTKNIKAERQFYSAGFTSQVSENVQLNVGAQLGRWKDENTLYTSDYGDEFAREDVNHWNVMAGFTFNF